jgi:hypothetical protein
MITYKIYLYGNCPDLIAEIYYGYPIVESQILLCANEGVLHKGEYSSEYLLRNNTRKTRGVDYEMVHLI